MRYVADCAATVALGDGEAAAPEKLIGLFASRESVRAQQLARGDLMGHRNRVLWRQVLALRRQAVVSAPSSRWHPVTDDEPYGFLNVCPGDAPWDHVRDFSSSRCRSAASTSVAVAAQKPAAVVHLDREQPAVFPSARQRRFKHPPEHNPGIDPLPPAVRPAGTFPAGDAPSRDRESQVTPSGRRLPVGPQRRGPPASNHHIERIVHRVDQRRVLVAFGQLDQFPSRRIRATMKRSVTASPSGLAARRMAAGAVRPVPRCPSGQGHPPRSPDTSPAAAAARRRRTASGSPGTPLPPSPDAPETLSADAPPAACGCSRLHRQAHDVVRPRRLEPAEDIAGVQRPGSRLDWSQDFTVAPLAPDRHRSAA